MAQWSTALFGHYKPKVEGWEYRAEPGDIIAVRPINEHGRWTPTERKEFLIVILDDFDLSQLVGLTEPYWDTNSIPVVPEEAMKDLLERNERLELRPQRHIKKRRFNIPLDDLRGMGVDIDHMLDKELIYSPEFPAIKKVGCFDKMNTRYARRGDGFNPIRPVTIGRLI